MEHVNILFVINIYPVFGGIGTVTDSIADHFGDTASVHVLSFTGIPEAPSSRHVRNVFHFPSRDVGECVECYRRILIREDIDFVINQGCYPEMSDIVFRTEGTRARVISELHGRPGYEKDQFWMLPKITGAPAWKNAFRKMLTAFGAYGSYRRYVGAFRDAYRKAARSSAALVLLDEGFRDDFITLYGCRDEASRIRVIPNPLPASYTAVTPVPSGEKEDIILFSGRLSPEKQVGDILEVWKRVSAPGWKLVLLGDGEMRGELEEKVRKDRLSNVIFAGFRPCPQEWYAKARILLLTSRFEGFPLCLIEAMRYGAVPVSYNMSSGVESILEEGGVLVEHPDPAEMALQVSRLMEDPALWENWSAKAYRKSGRYLSSQVGRQWQELFGKL